MSEEKFEELLSKVQNSVKKQDTVMRQAISPKLKLQVTLRYLATGDSFQTLAFLYRVPKNTISSFLAEVCPAIYDALKDFIKVPHTEDEWKNIEKEYYFRWNFTKCCGALDGKHIVIRNASHSGFEYFNYKGTYSLILFACVDANYCFRYFDIGTNGRANETYILKPFGRSTHLSRKQKIYNYRLSRARRIVENAFGILVSRFRVFERPIAIGIDKVDVVVKATLALHNWLKTSSGETYTPIGSFDTEDLNTRQIVPGSWRTQSTEARALVNLQTNLGSRNYTTSASTVRDQYAEYCSGHGAVPWQLNMIHDDE
nr:unnamed protein product [Callosobruchus analis]